MTEKEESEIELRRPPRRNHRDDNATVNGVKLKIPSFQGKPEPKTYLEWERRMKLVFDCHNYIEVQKVKLAIVEFLDYAITWRDQLTTVGKGRVSTLLVLGRSSKP